MFPYKGLLALCVKDMSYKREVKKGVCGIESLR